MGTPTSLVTIVRYDTFRSLRVGGTLVEKCPGNKNTFNPSLQLPPFEVTNRDTNTYSFYKRKISEKSLLIRNRKQPTI